MAELRTEMKRNITPGFCPNTERVEKPTFTFSKDISQDFIVIDEFVIKEDHVAVNFTSRLDIKSHVNYVFFFCPMDIERLPLSQS